jgi:hypothetical protein
MPNGGTDCCMNCSHNRTNSSPQDYKVGDSSSRISFCMLRLVAVYNRAWTYCGNFTHRAPEDVVPIGSIYSQGLRGYDRIPWYGPSEPELRTIRSCTICNQENGRGIRITLSRSRQLEFCSNEHYEEWVRDNPYEEDLDSFGKELFQLVRDADEPGVETIVKNFRDVNIRDGYYRSALHWAGFQGNSNITRILVKAGVELNATDRNNWTPLHFASFFGRDAAAKELLELGANPAVTDWAGMQPIDMAGSEGHTQIVSALLESSYSTDNEMELALLEAARQGNLSLTEALIGAGVNIECADEDGWTPLLKAVYEGHVTVSVFLLDQGADVNAKNKYGYTPYSITHTWTTSGMEELKTIVLSRGASP